MLIKGLEMKLKWNFNPILILNKFKGLELDIEVIYNELTLKISRQTKA